MYLSEQLQKKWEGVLEHSDLDPIKDPYRKAVTAVILENQAQEMQKAAGILNETGSPTNFAGTGGFGGSAAAAGPVAGFDPILISLVRRSLPNLIAYDVCGVQPMTGPTGLIFAMRSRYSSQAGTEAFYNEANTGFGGVSGPQTSLAIGAAAANTFVDNAAACTAMTTATAESLDPAEMAFSIEKVTVAAKTRALKAAYTMELAPSPSTAQPASSSSSPPTSSSASATSSSPASASTLSSTPCQAAAAKSTSSSASSSASSSSSTTSSSSSTSSSASVS